MVKRTRELTEREMEKKAWKDPAKGPKIAEEWRKMSKQQNEPREFTYETGIDEPLHPSEEIRADMREVGLSSCPSGCKIYKHPAADVLVLSHNASYGCKRTRQDILDEHLH